MCNIVFYFNSFRRLAFPFVVWPLLVTQTKGYSLYFDLIGQNTKKQDKEPKKAEKKKDKKYPSMFTLLYQKYEERAKRVHRELNPTPQICNPSVTTSHEPYKKGGILKIDY